MCLMCEEEAFFQAYMAYMARKQAGAADEASAFKAEAVATTGDLERAGDTLGTTSAKRGEGVPLSLRHDQNFETDSAALLSTISAKGAR